MAKKGMGGHERANEGLSDDWLTPPELIEALGPFDLDPCASVSQPWPTAKTMWTIRDQQASSPFQQEWSGFVWLNPPYGRKNWGWMEKMADHGHGIALIFARTDSNGFFRTVWERATSLYFLRSRLHFHRPITGEPSNNNAGSPSVLVGYGKAADRRLKGIDRSRFPGQFISLSH